MRGAGLLAFTPKLRVGRNLPTALPQWGCIGAGCAETITKCGPCWAPMQRALG